MFRIADIKNEFEKLDAKTGMNIANTVPIFVSNRCKTTRGQYKFTFYRITKEIKDESITIAAFVMNESEPDFLDTVRHEYVHAMATRLTKRNDIGHGEFWKQCCREVGCVPEASRIATEAQKAVLNNRKKYIVKCAECGKEFIYHRKGKIISMVESGNTENLTCPKCGNHNFILKQGLTNQKGGDNI